MELIRHETPDGLVWSESPGLTECGAAHGFSTRLGGVSKGVYASLNLGHTRGDDPAAVRENYRRFCEATGAGRAEDLILSHQIHEDEIRVCTLADRGKGLDRERDYDCDGLMTDIPNLPLVIFSADCIPILLCDPVRRVVAACHAGWRGTALRIAEKTAAKMQTVYGCRPSDLRAAIGPGIGPCCFTTHEDVPQAMEQSLGALASAYITPAEGDKYHVDLKAINAALLKRAGVPSVDISRDCTACHTDVYWSHRIVGAARGSMAAVIMLK